MTAGLTQTDLDWGYEFGCDGTMRVSEAAEHFDIPLGTLRHWIRQRRIRASKPFGKLYVCVHSIVDAMKTGEV